MWCITGLGNPGDQYRATRHNIGFDLIDLLAARWKTPVSQKGQNFLFGSGNFRNVPFLLVKPMTYMNRSGDAFRRILRDPEVKPERSLIILDDFSLPLGKMRIRQRGSGGGHNGLGSILETLGNEDIPRLRIGIGDAGKDWVDFVLEPFPDKEREIIDETLQRAAQAIEMILLEGVEKAMSRFNK